MIPSSGCLLLIGPSARCDLSRSRCRWRPVVILQSLRPPLNAENLLREGELYRLCPSPNSMENPRARDVKSVTH
jgi:hypothetical protein